MHQLMQRQTVLTSLKNILLQPSRFSERFLSPNDPTWHSQASAQLQRHFFVSVDTVKMNGVAIAISRPTVPSWRM